MREKEIFKRKCRLLIHGRKCRGEKNTCSKDNTASREKKVEFVILSFKYVRQPGSGEVW